MVCVYIYISIYIILMWIRVKNSTVYLHTSTTIFCTYGTNGSMNVKANFYRMIYSFRCPYLCNPAIVLNDLPKIKGPQAGQIADLPWNLCYEQRLIHTSKYALMGQSLSSPDVAHSCLSHLQIPRPLRKVLFISVTSHKMLESLRDFGKDSVSLNFKWGLLLNLDFNFHKNS